MTKRGDTLKRLTRIVTYVTLETRDTLLKGEATMKTVFDKKAKNLADRLEDIFMTVVYAEAADLKDLQSALKNDMELAHPDECQYGDNELCYNES